MNMLFRRQQRAIAAARCTALRCAKARAWKQNQRTTDRTCFKLYDICTEFDVKIQQQIIRNPTGVVEGFQERSGRAPGAKTDE